MSRAPAAAPARTADAVRTGPPLRLLREARLADLLDGLPGGRPPRRLEASGVARRDGLLWVVCDNLPHLVGVDPALGRDGVRLLRRPGPAAGYEDLTWDDAAGRWFVLVEAAPTAGGFRPQLDELDGSGRLLARRWVELAVHDPNKGLEGLTTVRRGGRTWLLALSEGNGGRGGRRGRRPGRGLAHVLDRRGDAWAVVDTVHLPTGLPFTDFSALSVRGDTLAVASQESSALWIGRLRPDRWEVADAGRVHPFPRDRHGRVRYGTVEGLCWLDARTLAVVSDRPKRGLPARLRRTGESVHVVEVPAEDGAPDPRERAGAATG